MTLFPKLAMGGWIGRQRAADPGVQAIVRALGIRDAVIGVGGLLAHRKGDQDQSMWWLRFGALSDLVDAIATWKARRSLPHSAKGVAAFATTAAATQLILSTHDRS